MFAHEGKSAPLQCRVAGQKVAAVTAGLEPLKLASRAGRWSRRRLRHSSSARLASFESSRAA